MSRDESRALRFASGWMGPSLAALVGIGSTVELGAMPVAPTGPQLPAPILIQQSTGSQADVQGAGGTTGETAREEATPDSFIELHEALAAARQRLEELSRAAEAVAASGELQRELAALQEQNERLQAEVAAVRAERAELETAKQAAEARARELIAAAEEAKVKAQEMDQELVAMRWQNAQLNTSLAQARTMRDQAEAEARRTEEALRAQLEELEADAEQAGAEAARLRESLQQTEQDKARVEQDLARLETELASAEERLEATQQERQRIAALEDERDQLRDQLAAVTERLERTEAANARLEGQVADLREAAGTATDVARQNLIAVENRIRELNEALAEVGPAGGPFEADHALIAERGAPAGGEQAEVEAPGSATPVENVAAAPPAEQDDQPSGAAADLQQLKAASAPDRSDDGEAVAMLADLPLEQRLHVQGLLADLDSKMEEQGLITTVPGELLFAVNSDEVQESAHDTLAKVAELISMYDDREILIIGHSDAVGDAAYNKQLSERRAGLVKEFFIDNFELDEDRLSTQGWGESRPIASNATREGRRANRRVEVLILN